jgi:hypothetical protein
LALDREALRPKGTEEEVVHVEERCVNGVVRATNCRPLGEGTRVSEMRGAGHEGDEESEGSE